MLSFSQYLSNHTKIVEELKNTNSINELIECIWNISKDENSMIFTVGNGGSASTAEHFSADLGQMEKRTGHAIRSVCLNSQIALSSAFANDLNFQSVISQQLSSYKNSNFVFVAFSASGNSENILRALDLTISYGKETFCFVGFDGGKVIKMNKVNSIYFPDARNDYGVAENLHLMASHYIVDRLIEKFTENTK
jgi:D-sedoheptulose 7-phosphate isomerase